MADAKVDSGIVWLALEEAMDELPDGQRAVFVWHEMEGKSFNEIAAMAGTAVNTLLSWKRYAVLYLREKLKDLYNEMIV